MAWLLAVALFVVGAFIMDSSQFIGFLIILAGVFALLVKTQEAARVAREPSPQSHAPIIIKTGSHAPQPEFVKMRIKGEWSGTTSYEDLFSNLSDIVLFPVKILWRLLRVGGGKKK